MHILHFIYSLNIGGGSNHVRMLVDDLQHHSSHSVIGGSGNNSTGFNRSKIKFFKAGKKIFLPFLLVYFIKIHKPDVLHLHGRMSGIIGRLICKFIDIKGLKVVYTVHGFGFENDGPLKKLILKFFEKILASSSYFTIFVSDEERLLYESTICVSKKIKYKIIYNYSCVPANSPAVIQTKKESCVKLVYVGRFSRQKGVDILIRAFDFLSHTNFNIDLYGEGPDELILKEMSALSKFVDRIRFRGIGSNIQHLLTNYDAIIIPSRFEGLPYILIESISCGIPVICTPCRGINEFINFTNGYKSEFITPESLAKSIDNYLDDLNDDTCKVISKINSSQRLLLDKFNRVVQLEKLIEVYKS